jgi:hypothetical protein
VKTALSIGDRFLPFGKIADKKLAIAATFLLGIFFTQGLLFIQANSQTFDEAVYLAAGYSYLATGDFRLNSEHPPLLKELAALPIFLWYRLPFAPAPDLWDAARQWEIGRNFLYGSPVAARKLLSRGRIPTLLLGAVLVALVGRWSYRLWGREAALLGVALAALEPNMVAHGSLITLDLGVSLFLFLTLYLFWEYTVAPSAWLLVGLGISTGLALASKYSGLVLLPLLGAGLALHLVYGRSGKNATQAARPGKVRTMEKLGEAVTFVLIVACLALLTILASYLFHEDLSAWFRGLWLQMQHNERGHPAFFCGEYSGSGWWSYFPVAFLIKTPLGSIVLMLLSVLLFKAGHPLRLREALMLLGPAAFLFAIMMQSRINIGLRYLLPVYPLLFVLASRSATITFRWKWASRLLWGIPLAWTAASSICIAPHHLAYFNELVGGPGNGWRCLGSSNLDWGQDLVGLKQFMEREGVPMIYLSYFGTAAPEAYGIRYQYVPGFYWWPPPTDTLPPGSGRELFAISVDHLQGTHFADKERYHWLFSRTAVAKIGYSICVYDITADADAHLGLARIYEQSGFEALAAQEVRKVLALDPGNAEAQQLLEAIALR